MKSFHAKLFITFVLPFRARKPGRTRAVSILLITLFLRGSGLTRTRNLRDYLLFRLSQRFGCFIEQEKVFKTGFRAKNCNPFLARTIYEFAKRGIEQILFFCRYFFKN
jgi:hypothetical protein